MHVVIEISEELYKEYVSVNLARGNGKSIAYNLLKAIKKGTPLPEHHGRIIDESKIEKFYYYIETSENERFRLEYTVIDGTDAPTIIEGSDKE